MNKAFGTMAIGATLVVGLSATASAQGPGQARLAISNPVYEVIALETTSDTPAAEGWKRVGRPALRIQLRGDHRTESRNFFTDRDVERAASLTMVLAVEVNQLSRAHGTNETNSFHRW